MALMGLSLGATQEYVSPQDSGYSDKGDHSPDATVFVLGTLDSLVMGRIQDKLTDYKPDMAGGAPQSAKVNVHDVAFEACQFGIKDWRNFNNLDGEPIKCERTMVQLGSKTYSVVDAEVLCRLPLSVILELYGQIVSLNEAAMAEIKN